MLPLLEGGEEGEELALVDGVVVFRGVELLGETANELVTSLLVALFEVAPRAWSLASMQRW